MAKLLSNSQTISTLPQQSARKVMQSSCSMRRTITMPGWLSQVPGADLVAVEVDDGTTGAAVVHIRCNLSQEAGDFLGTGTVGVTESGVVGLDGDLASHGVSLGDAQSIGRGADKSSPSFFSAITLSST